MTSTKRCQIGKGKRSGWSRIIAAALASLYLVACTSDTTTVTAGNNNPPPNPAPAPSPTPPIADTTPPTINLTAPAAGNVSGTVTVSANAADNVGVVGVQFQLDGQNLGAEDTGAPYSVSWNTATATAGNHSLTAVARDQAGNRTTSSAVLTTVPAPAPPPATSGMTFAANPLHVSSGQATTLTWSSADMESCTASNGAGNSTWSGSKALTGSQAITLNVSTTFVLSCTGPNGNSERAVRVIVARPAAPNAPASVPNPSDLIFFDNFEYVVNRGNGTTNRDPAALTDCSSFAQRGWSWAKAINCNGSYNGFLYTVEPAAIPGHSGTFPGVASNRALAMEARPSYGGQTSFHLQYGNGEEAVYEDYIPGNVWMQFWIYIADSGNQRSQFNTRNKFLYPCNQAYPCHNHKWLSSVEPNNALPDWAQVGVPSQGTMFMRTDINGVYVDPATNAPISLVINDGVETYNYGKLGHTNNTDFFPITPNRWTLVKMHFNTAITSGVYEVWMRTQGGTWVKTIEWVDGVTPGFTWQVHRAHVGGHKVLSMPTTMGSATGWDSWVYLDDFAMAHSEAGLPVY